LTSQINPNNINGAYPVAGQDNNSQGFRDNFTNTGTNFQYAADEITDLQNKVVLKQALTGTILNNNMLGSLISNAQVQGFSETVVNLGTLSGNVNIDYSVGSYYTVTTGSSLNLGFTNFTAAGTQDAVTVAVTVSSTAYTLTLPVAVGTGASGASILGIEGLVNADPGTDSSVITFATTGTYQFQFITADNGSTIYLNELTRPRNYFTNPLFLTGSEDLANAAAASLTKTTSYFSTAAAETATLAAGAEGQIKNFAMYADLGDMVITVSNAGWKTSGTGTITFDTIGDACTLQYTNAKWFVIGNNGCTFA